MAIKIQGDNMQYGDTAIATLSTDALTLQSGTSLNAQKLTASNGMEVTNHMTAENGVVNVTGQLTASHGMYIYDGLTLAALNNNPADLMFTNVGSMECYGSAAFTAATFSVSADFAAGTVVTAAGKVTASNGMEITNHMVANNGVVTVSGQLTASNGLAVSGDVSFEDASFSGDVTLGDAATDVTTVTGQLTASNGLRVLGDNLEVFGRANFAGAVYISDQGDNSLLSHAPVDFRNDVALGDNGGNTITVDGRFGSDLLPITDSAHDLGSGTRQWAEAHVDHGHIDDITSTGTSNLATVNVTGQLTASNGARIAGNVVLGSDDSIKAGSYITYSDATLKENIEVISNPIDKVMSMRGVTYNFKSNSDNPEVGFLAQEMKQAVPEVVYGNGDGNLGIDYAKLTSVLVEAIKTQQTQIQEQQSQIDELKESLLKK